MQDLLHTGKNLNSSQKYENAIWALHPRGELKTTAAQLRTEKVSRLYSEWSEANEGHSKAEGKAKYREISENN